MGINILPIKTNLIFKKIFNPCSFTGIQNYNVIFFQKKPIKLLVVLKN